jgi:hypothetical protein
MYHCTEFVPLLRLDYSASTSASILASILLLHTASRIDYLTLSPRLLRLKTPPLRQYLPYITGLTSPPRDLCAISPPLRDFPIRTLHHQDYLSASRLLLYLSSATRIFGFKTSSILQLDHSQLLVVAFSLSTLPRVRFPGDSQKVDWVVDLVHLPFSS